MRSQPLLNDGLASGESGQDAPGLKIGEVSTLLGLAASTIRSWERRHALPTGTRDEYGRRRYSKADVAILRRTRDNRAAGLGVSRAVAAATVAVPLVLCQLLLVAIDLLDAEKITAVLNASMNAYGLPVTLDEVLLPAMREVGARWSRGKCDAPEEHLASGAILAWLAGHAAAAPPPLPDRPIVLSCGPQDQHTIALEAFDVLLRQQRFDCRNLGAQTSVASLKQAVDSCSAQAVVLVCQLPRNGPAAASALRSLSYSGAALFYAGAAFRTTASRKKMPGHYLGGSLSNAATDIASRLRPG